MSAIYAVAGKMYPDIRELSALGEKLQKGLENYGRGGASDPREGSRSLTFGENSFVLGSVQNNAHKGVPDSPCVFETEKHIAVCDAMLYNRNNFPGEESQSDSELLVKVYEREGLQGLKSLRADFSAILIEEKSGEIILLRDHMGIRPLYMLQTDRYIAFSTDYRPFFELPDHCITINETNLYEHLVMGTVSSLRDTLFTNITKAQAGSVTKVRLSGNVHPEQSDFNKASDAILSTVRYWTPGQRKLPKGWKDRSFSMYRKVYARLMRESVISRAEAVGGCGIGAEFSGGLDSGIIVSVLDEYAGIKDMDPPLLASWSPSVSDYPLRERYDEVIRDEREVIERFCREKGNTCIYRPRQDSENVQKYLDNIRREDICEYDSEIIRYTTEAFKGTGVRTVFSGWGGDEAATMRFGPALLLKSGEYPAFLKEAVHASGGKPRKFLGYVKRALQAFLENRIPWDGIKANGWDFSIAEKEYAARIERNREKSPYYFGWDPVKNLLSGGMESRTLLAASAAADAGMVYMFPMLDPLLIDYALCIPRSLFMKNGIRRFLPQKAMADIVPDYLTEFSGEPNVEKLDTGRMDFFYEVAEDTQRKTDKAVLTELDREIFGKYVDFEELERHLLDSENPFERNALRRIVRTLYKMQILLKKV